MTSLSNRPDFPSVIDSSIISAFRSCGQRGNLQYLEHWKPRAESVHLVAGKAYATGLEKAREAFYFDGRSEVDASGIGLKALIEAYGDFECPSDSAKSLERMCGALEFYFDRYPMSADKAIPITLSSGRRGIEFGFAEPLEILHPVSGDPIIYCGRMDMICDFAGAMYGEDDKTTGSLGATWSKQWDLRSQFTGYCWGAGKAGYPLAGFLVRGVSILKTKYDTQQALTYRPPWMIERWYEQLHRDIADAIRQWESGKWDFNLDHACMEFGGCVFRQVCQMPKPDPWLESNFIRRVWDPVRREESLV